MNKRLCLPRCFEPSWPDCSDPVQLCCFHLALPDDMCVEVEERDGDWSCDTSQYLCEEEWISGTDRIVTNLAGTIGLPFLFRDELDQWGSGWWGMNQIACEDLVALWDDAEFWYQNWWTENYASAPFPGNSRGWLYVTWSCDNGAVTIEGRIGLEAPESGGFSGCDDRAFFRTIVWSSPYWRVVVSPDWWKTIDSHNPGLYAGPLEIPIIENSLITTETPAFGPLKLSISHACDWSPCGDPLDCFASCLSGSVDCDGVTPAHKPVIFFTLSIPGFSFSVPACCLNGTYALTYQSTGTHGAGYYGGGSCERSGGGVTHYIEIALTCQGSGGTTINGPGDPAILWIDMTTTSSGPPLEWQWITGVNLGCSDGVLGEVSGSFTGSDCGLTGDGGWVIHG